MSFVGAALGIFSHKQVTRQVIAVLAKGCFDLCFVTQLTFEWVQQLWCDQFLHQVDQSCSGYEGIALTLSLFCIFEAWEFLNCIECWWQHKEVVKMLGY